MNYRGLIEEAMLYDMSNDIKEYIKHKLTDSSMTDNELKNLYQEVKSRKTLSRPREEIDWFPSIDRAKCTLCKICYDMCPKGVYTLEDGQLIIKNPYSCVFLCTGCAKKCPHSAIQFPDKDLFKKYVLYR